jgi:hypothetical protein
MSLQTWEETLYSSVADATQISNSTSETIMVPDTTIPAKYWYAGRTVKASLIGVMSNVVTTPGTLTIRARLGGVAGTLLAASAAIALNTTAQTNSQIWMEFLLTCRAVGWSNSSGSLFTSGNVNLGLSRSTQGLVDLVPASGNAVVGSLDLTSSSILSFTAQFSVSTNPTNLTINQFILEAMN